MTQRILIVEDEAAIATVLKDDLELERYAVDLCDDGAAACDRVAQGAYDLVILDAMLPGRSGFEVCRQLRSEHPDLPILMLTARSSEPEMVMGLELGADDYMTKPFSPLELRARLRALLRRASRADTPRQQFGELALDLDRMEVRAGSRPLDLTALEFKLLAALVRHAGKVLDRDRLLDLVWGAGSVLSDRVIDTHVANLRRKLGDSAHHIVSVRGVGYRFDP